MNPANYREALIETEADEAEGADILLVNFFTWIIDILQFSSFNVPYYIYFRSGVNMFVIYLFCYLSGETSTTIFRCYSSSSR
jgi:delta-aminolevulinic acid dehydratase/porphobilinogen synthase